MTNELEHPMRYRPLGALVPAVLALAVALPVTSLTASAAGAGPAGVTPVASATVIVNECEIRGRAQDIPGNVLTVKLRSASGSLRKTWAVTVSLGQWQVDCPGPRVRRGDRLQFFTSLSTTPFKVLAVPRLKLRPDRQHDRLRGNAPGPADTVEVSAGRCDPALVLCAKGFPKLVAPLGPGGAFDVAMAGLTGASLAILSWQRGDDAVVLFQQTGRMVVQPGRASVSGFGSAAGQKVTLRLRRGQAIGRSTPGSRADASFTGTFRRGGRPMKALAGDLVTASFAGDAAMLVPRAGIALNGAVDGVHGRCFRNAPVTVTDHAFDGSFAGYQMTTSDGNGRWSVTFGPISAGHTFTAWCGNARGDAVRTEILAL